MLKSLRPLAPYLRKYRTGYVWAIVSVLLNNAVWVLFPLVLGWAIDDLKHEVTREKLVRHALQLLAVVVVKGVFQFLTRWIVIGISRDIEFDLRNDLFRQLERLSCSFYQRTRTGDIMARATNDLNAVRMLLGPAIMYSANTLVLTVMALAFMVSISPRLTLYAFLPLPVASITIQYFGRRIHERFERIQAQFADISARAQENFSGARVLRAYTQERAETRSFETANREYIARSLKLVRLMGMLWPSLETMLQLAIVLVLWLGGREVIGGRITVGNFVTFNTYMVQLTWPVIALGWVINLFQRGTASLARIADIMNERPEIADAAATSKAIAPSATAARPTTAAQVRGTADAPDTISGDIEFRNLSFSYTGLPTRDGPRASGPDGAPVLAHINLHIPAGTSLAIVGPTGAGKSTLVSLIPRIYDAAAGAVLVDGRPIRDFPLETLRRHIGFVPQETFLFGETVRANIALGVDEAGFEDVQGAADAASIAAEVDGFPERYETMVGERGITLSGGQKQRVAIARALLRNPRILILDDALSSVDTHTEDRILNQLRGLMQHRTTIFISHRVSTVRNADRIAVLDGGRIVEYGTHEQLMARNGYYTELYNKQLLEEELAGEAV